MEKNPHHLIMGELKDFLTGKMLSDTHDERYRQKIASLLVHTLGYPKKNIEANRELIIRSGAKAARMKIDFIVQKGGHAIMMIKYAPGSLVTRRLSNLALSRIIFPYQIPLVVTTNGEDAEVISGKTGKVMAQGLDAIPGADGEMVRSLASCPEPVSSGLADKASKIAFACWIDGACPCDGDICNLEDG